MSGWTQTRVIKGPTGDPGAGGSSIPGPPGPAGPQGTAPGPAGQRGTQWFHGVGPASFMANALPNDNYFDVFSGNVYQYQFIPGTHFSDGSATGGQFSVQVLHDSPQCVNGDIIVLPPGPFRWSTQVIITKSITLQGAGYNYIHGIDPTAIGLTADTIIMDDSPGGNPLISFNYQDATNHRPRLTGIEFQNGNRTTALSGQAGIITLRGSTNRGNRFRLDHCHFNDTLGTSTVFQQAIGLVDHCTYTQRARGAGFKANCYHADWSPDAGPIYDFGDGSWIDPVHWGGEKWLFFEDCTFWSNYGAPSTTPTSICDGYDGTRYVARYCYFNHKQVQTHGTDSGGGSGNARGSRACEVYNNFFDSPTASNYAVCTIRGGSWLFHHNDIRGAASTGNIAGLAVTYDRSMGNARFSGADGISPFDVNEPGGPFATATVVDDATVIPPWDFLARPMTGGRTGNVVTVENVQGIPVLVQNGVFTDLRTYVIHNKTLRDFYRIGSARPDWGPGPNYVSGTTNVGGASIQNSINWFNQVLSNNGNVITYDSRGFFGQPMRFCPGDQVEIWKVNLAIDMIGVGNHSNGVSFLQRTGATVTDHTGPNNQVIDPCYQWQNTATHRTTGRTTAVNFGDAPPQYAGIHLKNMDPNDDGRPYTTFRYPHPLQDDDGGKLFYGI